MTASRSRQADVDVRFEWGPTGVEALRGDTIVVVDVLRFTTAVEAATGRGAHVFPCRWTDGTAAVYARDVGATLADGTGEHGLSLSPVSLLGLSRGDRVVLPSLNGSICSAAAADTGAIVVAACLRNAPAVAEWVDGHAGTVTVIAAGERLPDGSLRPALEDYLGAGAVIAGLSGTASSEARAAAGVWRDLEGEVAGVLATCASGRECAQRGWAADLHYAGHAGSSEVVPVLRAGAFVDVNG